jgi:undecaprenyl-diphosphatase
VALVFFDPDRWARFMYPRTLAFLGSLCAVLIVLSILVRLRATYKLDVASTLALQRWSGPIVDKVMRRLTWLGNSLTVCMFAGGAALAAVYVRDWRAVLFIGLSLLSLPINIVLKNWFDRERPGEKEVKVHPGPRWGFSYPSGHTMGSTAFYGWIAILIYLYTLDPAMRYGLVTLFSAIPLLVGMSRIYMGAHWLSDVVGGVAGGTILLSILAVLYPV